MISKHGTRLISPNAEDALKHKLFPHAHLVTPNIPEAEVLTGMAIESESDMIRAAERLRNFGCRAVVIKGGHSAGVPVDILLLDGDRPQRFVGERVNTLHTHGTGCTFSAAITAGLALGKNLEESIHLAKSFVQRALKTAPGLGKGNGPLNHFAASG